MDHGWDERPTDAGGDDGACAASGDDSHCLEILCQRLKRRSEELRSALTGEVLAMNVFVQGASCYAVSVVMSPDGHASLLPMSRARPAPAHLTLRGSHEELVRYVLGEVGVTTAIHSGLLQLHVAEVVELAPRYPAAMRIVAEEIWALLEGT